MSVGNCGDRVSDLPATGVCELTTGDRVKIAGGKEDRREKKGIAGGKKKIAGGKITRENRREIIAGKSHQEKSPGRISGVQGDEGVWEPAF